MNIASNMEIEDHPKATDPVVNIVRLAIECEHIWNERGRSQARMFASSRVLIDELIANLDNPNRLVRSKTLFVLSFFEAPTILSALVDCLAEDPCPIVRHEAAYFLGSMQYSQAVPALGLALLNDPDEIVRHEAAEALGESGFPSALPYLLRARNDSSSIVRDTIDIAEMLIRTRG